MQEDLGSKTKSSLIWSSSLKLVFQVYKFAVAIVIARILEPKDFGIMGIASMIVFYANSLTNFGFSRALIYKKEINKAHINSVFTINMVVSLVLTIITFLLSGKVAGFFKVPELTSVLLLLSSVYIITSFSTIPMTLLKRGLDFKILALNELYRGILQTIVTLVLALLGFRYWALITGLLCSQVYGVIYLLYKVSWKPKIEFDRNAIKEIFNFGFWDFVRAQTFQVNEYADKFIIGKFLGPVLLGFYDKAYSTVAFQKNNFTAQVNAVMFSSFSRLDPETSGRVKKYFKKAISATALVVFPVNTYLAVLSAHFVVVLFGDKWSPMIVPLEILSVAFMFNFLSGLIASLNIGTGSYLKQIKVDISCNILLIIICLLAVQRGIEFVASGILLIYTLIFFLTFQITKRTTDVGWHDLIESVAPAVIGSLVMAFFVLIFRTIVFHEVNMINFLAMSAIGGLSYVLAVFVPDYAAIREPREQIMTSLRNYLTVLKRFLMNKRGKL